MCVCVCVCVYTISTNVFTTVSPLMSGAQMLQDMLKFNTYRFVY